MRSADGAACRSGCPFDPLPDPRAVEAFDRLREHGVQILLGVAADGGEARVEGYVLEVVEPRKQIHLGELADTG